MSNKILVARVTDPSKLTDKASVLTALAKEVNLTSVLRTGFSGDERTVFTFPQSLNPNGMSFEYDQINSSDKTEYLVAFEVPAAVWDEIHRADNFSPKVKAYADYAFDDEDEEAAPEELTADDRTYSYDFDPSKYTLHYILKCENGVVKVLQSPETSEEDTNKRTLAAYLTHELTQRILPQSRSAAEKLQAEMEDEEEDEEDEVVLDSSNSTTAIRHDDSDLEEEDEELEEEDEELEEEDAELERAKAISLSKTSETAAAKKETVTVQMTPAQAQARIKHLESLNNELSGRNDQLITSNDKLIDRDRQRTADMAKLQGQIENLTAIAQARGQLTPQQVSAINRFVSIENNNERLRAQMRQLTSTNESLQTQLATALSQATSKSQSGGDLSGDMQAIMQSTEAENRKLKEENEYLQTLLASFQSSVKAEAKTMTTKKQQPSKPTNGQQFSLQQAMKFGAKAKRIAIPLSAKIMGVVAMISMTALFAVLVLNVFVPLSTLIPLAFTTAALITSGTCAYQIRSSQAKLNANLYQPQSPAASQTDKTRVVVRRKLTVKPSQTDKPRTKDVSPEDAPTQSVEVAP